MHMEFAQLFNKPFFRKPMEAGNDMLMNLHANTHLAQVGSRHRGAGLGGEVGERRGAGRKKAEG